MPDTTFKWNGKSPLPVPITNVDSDGLQAAASLSSLLSILFICYTAYMEWGKGSRQISFPNKLIGYEIFINFIMCLATLSGRCGSLNGCPTEYCKAQGFMVQISGLASHFWMGFVAWKMYQWIVLSKHEARLQKKIPTTFGFIAAIAFIAATVLVSEDKIGQCASWCWINGPPNKDISNARMWSYYAYLLSSWTINVLVLVIIALRRKSPSGAKKRLAVQDHAGVVQNKLALYVFVFSFCWFFSVFDFIVEYAIPRDGSKDQNGLLNMEVRPIYYPSALAAAIFTPLHGFGNCLVFHGYFDWVIPWMTRAFPLFCRQVFVWMPFLSTWCKCCVPLIAENSSTPESGKNDGKKFVVRRASAAFTGGMGFKPKRGSVIDKIDRYALFANEGAGGIKSKSPVGVPGAPEKGGRVAGGEGSAASPQASQNNALATSAASAGLKGPGTQYVPKMYSIFVTTFNMGEAKLSSFSANLGDWILQGHDIYSVGVQECMDLSSVREAIHAHLGGPDEYKMYCSEIGSDNTNFGYHGYIALTVFVRTCDFNAGHVRETRRATTAMATGKNLIITTAQNKGAVGIPFQIHDTSVGFLSSHLPSDQKGASKLAKRNSAACTILKEVVLAPEDVDFDMHLQHDHVFFSGDMNYRMMHEADGPYLATIVEACKAEKSVLGDDPQWLARKYSLLRSPKGDDPMYPKDNEMALIQAAKKHSEDLWVALLEADELRQTMQRGDAFTNFGEELAAFPPTYKRTKAEKGCDGGCGDYTDLQDFMRGFSHTGAVVDSEGAGASEDAQSTAGSREVTGGTESDHVAGGVGMSAVGRDLEQGSGGGRAVELTAGVGVTVASQRLSRKKDSKQTKNLRPPSYTDRVLVHSLDDRQCKLVPIAYDMCDRVRCSDHRPVSLVCQLEVNASVLFPTHFNQPLTEEEMILAERSVRTVVNAVTGKEERVAQCIVGSSTLYLFELCIAHLTVELYEQEGLGADPHDGAAGGAGGAESPTASGEGGPVLSPMIDEDDEARVGVVLHKAQLARSNTQQRHSETEVGPGTGIGRSASRGVLRSTLSRDSIPEEDEVPVVAPGAVTSVKSTSGNGGKGLAKQLGALAKYIKGLLADDLDQKTPDATISEIEIVFPLPSKDPLCREKSAYRMAQAFGHKEEDEDLVRCVSSRVE